MGAAPSGWTTLFCGRFFPGLRPSLWNRAPVGPAGARHRGGTVAAGRIVMVGAARIAAMATHDAAPAADCGVTPRAAGMAASPPPAPKGSYSPAQGNALGIRS